MNVVKWVVVIGLAYCAGYFSDFSKQAEPTQSQDDCVPVAQISAQSAQSPAQGLETIEAVANNSTSSKVSQQKIASSSVANNDVSNAAPQLRQAMPKAETPPGPSSAPTKSNISDEEIDNLLPAPFNTELKRSSGPLREQYKKFAETKEPNEWDALTESRMTDLLLGNSYSKFIELDSVKCRANYCEIRGRELKKNVFSLLMSEMTIQDWWTMGHSQWGTGENGVFYGLIMKDHSTVQVQRQ